ncbi:MAG TPA: FAD-linked oxidase C-terminal domain-containing protein [Candidatus Acidoferrales bacterium]|nr:FAD-linked oxidase C-terminal domain-containing protein [Candidatus Acidoferrales bacterium]
MALTADALAELRALLGEDGVLASEAARFTYEADAMTQERAAPEVVALPRSGDEVSAVVRWARAHGAPVTPRGAGTGLAGGCTCEQGGVSLSLNRMDRILRVDEERMFAWVQPGLVNLWLSQRLAPTGLYFAPDPASQQVSTIGGNVSTNAGGPHCLKYGVTLNHVLGATVVLEDGAAVTLGGEACDAPGDDLLGIVVGSEGTLAIVTSVCVRLLPRPEAVRTLLFDFDSIADACNTVSRAIAEGIVPAAMEIMDRHTVTLVEAWLHLGLPTDAAAVLLIEVDGPAVALPAQAERVTALALAHRARSTRVARDEAERAQLWRGRKSSFGAYGRTASGFYIMDGVVPRTRLAEALARVYELAASRGLEAGNVFHAGDGNLHPHVLFDAASKRQQQDALEISHEILRMCIRFGGTISGEHGVGMEKRPMMTELFAADDLAVMERARAAFDPGRRLNPGKILPGGAGCGEAHARRPAQLGGQRPRADAEGPWI